MNFGSVPRNSPGVDREAGLEGRGEPRVGREADAGGPRGRAEHQGCDPGVDGASEEEIAGLLDSTLETRDGERLIGSSGKTRLFDGRSAAHLSRRQDPRAFDGPLLDDHAAAAGRRPSSVANARFGEMEVWAFSRHTVPRNALAGAADCEVDDIPPA
ncbi:hypothetical protein FQA39_LY19436 [Lamprigera yunnana]|nr:hypothetical protein FQA39_LY19436 [Lamprigera yunnana]